MILLSGCVSLQEIAALREVHFHIDHVGNAALAGFDLTEVTSVHDIDPRSLLRLTSAVRNKELPMSFRLHLGAENPADNDVDARLIGLEWTLFIEDRQTVSGSLNEEIVMPPGQSVDIPIAVEIELFRFFDKNMADMFDLARNIAGFGGQPKELRLEATPTVNTPVGPIKYPGSIQILERRVGTE